jgi:energy-coupling factor transporter ATP-binding protein EcfA2
MVEAIEVHEPPAAFVRPSPDALIRCEGLEKWCGGMHALKGLDFHPERAEVVGLVGDNGAGKSTLIELLSGAHRPDGGRILIEGKEVRLASPSVAMSLGIETIYQSAVLDSPEFDRHFRPDLLAVARATRAIAFEERPFSTLGIDACTIVGDHTTKALTGELGVRAALEQMQRGLDQLPKKA